MPFERQDDTGLVLASIAGLIGVSIPVGILIFKPSLFQDLVKLLNPSGTTPNSQGGTGTNPVPTSGMDKFGIKQLYPSVGREWFSNWDNGKARTWSSKGIEQRNADPEDPEADLHANTKGSKCTVDGKGKMVMEGQNPRLYVNSEGKKWQNVEMTTYFKSLGPFPTDGSSVFCRLAGRSEHQKEYSCVNSGRTMGALEIKANKVIQIRKEYYHPFYDPNVISSTKGPARNVRWGMKLILRNKGNAILSEGYIDQKADNNWEKVVEKLDTGPVAPDSTDICKRIPDKSIWLGPATSCYLRCDGNVMEFDSFSIREIAPISTGNFARAYLGKARYMLPRITLS